MLQDLRIGIAHRSPHYAELLRTVLYAYGVRDIVHIDGRSDPMEAFAKAEPDILILDLGGPPVGAEFLTQLRHRKKSPNAFVPAIIASSVARLRDIKQAIDLGAHDFVALPLRPRDLIEKIRFSVMVGRPWVDAERYYGPCRRRRESPDYEGAERRAKAWEGQAALERAKEQLKASSAA